MPRKYRPIKECRKCGTLTRGFRADMPVCKDCAVDLAQSYRTPKTKLQQYGLTADDHSVLYVRQAGKCGICGDVQDQRTLAVDHDHATGAVRGLLCMGCNTGLGLFKDDITRLAKAIVYLQHPPR